MDSYKAYVECKCSEHMLIDAFNFLYAVFHKEHVFQISSGWTPSFAFCLQKFRGGYQRHVVSSPETALSQAKRFLNFRPDELAQTWKSCWPTTRKHHLPM